MYKCYNINRTYVKLKNYELPSKTIKKKQKLPYVIHSYLMIWSKEQQERDSMLFFCLSRSMLPHSI